MENIVHASVLSLIDEYRNLFSMLGIMLVLRCACFRFVRAGDGERR